jgi:hypothetical protein
LHFILNFHPTFCSGRLDALQTKGTIVVVHNLSLSFHYWKHGMTNLGRYTTSYDDADYPVSGFVTSLPWFLFPAKLKDNDDELPFKFCLEMAGEVVKWPVDDISGNEGELTQEIQFGIITAGERPFRQAWQIVLVKIWLKRADRLLFADYVYRVQVWGMS